MFTRTIASLTTIVFILAQCGLASAAPIYKEGPQNLRPDQAQEDVEDLGSSVKATGKNSTKALILAALIAAGGSTYLANDRLTATRQAPQIAERAETIKDIKHNIELANNGDDAAFGVLLNYAYDNNPINEPLAKIARQALEKYDVTRLERRAIEGDRESVFNIERIIVICGKKGAVRCVRALARIARAADIKSGKFSNDIFVLKILASRDVTDGPALKRLIDLSEKYQSEDYEDGKSPADAITELVSAGSLPAAGEAGRLADKGNIDIVTSLLSAYHAFPESYRREKTRLLKTLVTIDPNELQKRAPSLQKEQMQDVLRQLAAIGNTAARKALNEIDNMPAPLERGGKKAVAAANGDKSEGWQDTAGTAGALGAQAIGNLSGLPSAYESTLSKIDLQVLLNLYNVLEPRINPSQPVTVEWMVERLLKERVRNTATNGFVNVETPEARAVIAFILKNKGKLVMILVVTSDKNSAEGQVQEILNEGLGVGEAGRIRMEDIDFYSVSDKWNPAELTKRANQATRVIVDIDDVGLKESVMTVLSVLGNAIAIEEVEVGDKDDWREALIWL